MTLCLAFIVPVVLIAIAIAFELWCTRGTSSEEDRTRHRLQEHHGLSDGLIEDDLREEDKS